MIFDRFFFGLSVFLVCFVFFLDFCGGFLRFLAGVRSMFACCFFFFLGGFDTLLGTFRRALSDGDGNCDDNGDANGDCSGAKGSSVGQVSSTEHHSEVVTFASIYFRK